MDESVPGKCEDTTIAAVLDQEGKPEPPTMTACVASLLEANRFVTLDQLLMIELAWPPQDRADKVCPITA